MLGNGTAKVDRSRIGIKSEIIKCPIRRNSDERTAEIYATLKNKKIPRFSRRDERIKAGDRRIKKKKRKKNTMAAESSQTCIPGLVIHV